MINNSNNMHKVTHLSRELKSLSRYNIKKNKKSSYLHIQNKNLLSNLLSERMEDLHPDQRACSSIIQCVRTSRRISKTLRFLKRKSERILHSIIYFKQQQLPFPKKKKGRLVPSSGEIADCSQSYRSYGGFQVSKVVFS